MSRKTLDDDRTFERYLEKGRAAGRISFAYEEKRDALERMGLARDGRLTSAAAVLFCMSDRFMFKCGIFAMPTRTTILDIRR